MLNKLYIENIALIDRAEIEFKDGLNVLSGETGAGKSVIIESINFVLGAKADKTLIRSGETCCTVSAEFSVADNEIIQNLFREFGFDPEDLIIITRKFSIDGKSSIKLNGNTVTVGMLRRFTSAIVDVHGQSEHFELLSNSNQLDVIDRIGGAEISGVKNDLKKFFSQYKSVLTQIEELGGDENQRLIRLDILNFQIKEIEECDIKDGEEEELLLIRKKLQSQEKICNALRAVKDAIDSEGGVDDILSNSSKILAQISDFGAEYASIYERLESVCSEIGDISDTACSLLDDFDYSEYNADYIESRIEQIKKIKKKYGASIEEISAFLQSAKTEKSKLENFNEIAGELVESKRKYESKIYECYQQLSFLRKKYSNTFADNVLFELKELGMKDAQFNILFQDAPDIESCAFNSSNGFDEIQFMFSANRGEPLKPLSAVISGGEMSRFMLAIKAQTAKYNYITTFLFDEIDTGISGNIAKIVSEKFAKISKNVQVIAITHLPQISAMADNNLLIEKIEAGDRTSTIVKTLDRSSKIKEICRLAGGLPDNEIAIKHAESVIETAEKFKKAL